MIRFWHSETDVECVNKCEAFRYGQLCVEQCPQSYYSSDGDQLICQPYCAGFKVIQPAYSMGTFQCVESCKDPTRYWDPTTRECLNACPSGVHDENGACVASLNECVFYQYDNTGASRVCVSSCSKFVEARQCVSGCSQSRPYIEKRSVSGSDA